MVKSLHYCNNQYSGRENDRRWKKKGRGKNKGGNVLHLGIYIHSFVLTNYIALLILGCNWTICLTQFIDNEFIDNSRLKTTPIKIIKTNKNNAKLVRALLAQIIKLFNICTDVWISLGDLQIQFKKKKIFFCPQILKWKNELRSHMCKTMKLGSEQSSWCFIILRICRNASST